MKTKIAKFCNIVFGYGMLIALFVAFVLFVGFVVSFFIGDAAAGALTTFLYKTVLPKTYVLSVIVSIFGIVGMYLRGEKAMLMSKKPKKKTN